MSCAAVLPASRRGIQRPAQTTPASRLPTRSEPPTRARDKSRAPKCYTAPASTNDTCVAPANAKRAPHVRGKGPGRPNAALASTNDTCVPPANAKRAPARPPRARARAGARSVAPKCCACQHKRHLQREASPARARVTDPRPQKAQTTAVSHLPTRSEPPHARRGAGPGPPSAVPASNNDTRD